MNTMTTDSQSKQPEVGRAAGLSYRRWPGTRAYTPLVLLHGIGSNASVFDALAGALGNERQQLAWNAPGYDTSDQLTADWPSANDYASALDGLLRARQLTKVVMIGHSLGALIAARYAVAHPESVAGLILVSPAVGFQAPLGGPMPQVMEERLAELQQIGPAEFAKRRSPRLVSQPDAMPDILAAATNAMAAVNIEGYTRAMRLLACGWIVPDLAQLTMPALVICGSRDQITPPEQATRAADALSEKARSVRDGMILVDGAGHALPQEQPQRLAALIDEFLKPLDSRHDGE